MTSSSETKSITTQVHGHEIGPVNTNYKEIGLSLPAGKKDGTSEEDSVAQKDAPADAAIADQNLVHWDGPNDPANPRNWSKAQNMLNIALVSLSVLYSYV